jgi:hypothetical protein
MMSDLDLDKCPNCERRGDETPLHACGDIVYRCVECDIYFYFCQQQKRKIDIGAIDTYFSQKIKNLHFKYLGIHNK